MKLRLLKDKIQNQVCEQIQDLPEYKGWRTPRGIVWFQVQLKVGEQAQNQVWEPILKQFNQSGL